MKSATFFVVLASVATTLASCIDKDTYYGIDNAVETIAAGITDEDELVHFFGGVVRMAAHDFMDYDRHSDEPMGPDGCIEWSHDDNKGMWGSIWCDDGSCALTNVYKERFSHISRADFWIACANAVVRQRSIDQSLDLIDTFLWGRKDADSCKNQGDRIPTGSGCREVEDILLDSMGLTWRDAVALLGAHTIGRGHKEFTGHDGYWMPTSAESLVFDKQYYEELVSRPWRPRSVNTEIEDFFASTERTHEEPQMMLKTDICLWFDTDDHYPCCSRTNKWIEPGQNWCDVEETYSDNECSRYKRNDRHMETVSTVTEFLGGGKPNKNNEPFYKAFAVAWFKATTNGHDNLKAVGQC